MRIITNFSALGIDLDDYGLGLTTLKDASKEVQADLRLDLFYAARDAYASAVEGTDYYLYESIDAERFVFGAVDPDKLLNEVDGWNTSIVARLQPALLFADVIAADGSFTLDKIPLDSPATYELKKAARELDNDWFPLSDHAVYLENECGFPSFYVQLTDNARAAIHASPEEYLIIEVMPK